MTFSTLISGTVPHHNKYNARPGRVTRVIQHHWADTTMGGETSLASPGRKASVNYLVHNDGTILGQVPEEFRPWTSGGPAADNSSITIEVQNETGAPEWKVSDAAISSIVRLLADIATRHGFASLNAQTYRGHREFAATACPGPYLFPRLQQIRDAANALRDGGVVVVDNPLPPPVVLPPTGPVVIANGVPAPAYPLAPGYYFGPKAGPVQSVSGYYSHRADLRRWQQRMRDRGWDITVDGLYGPQTAKVAHAFQAEKGLVADGLIGPVTWATAWTAPITR